MRAGLVLRPNPGGVAPRFCSTAASASPRPPPAALRAVRGPLPGRRAHPLSEPLGSWSGGGAVPAAAILQVWLATPPRLRRGARGSGARQGGACGICSVGWRMLRAGPGLRPALDCGQGSGTFWGLTVAMEPTGSWVNGDDLLPGQ